MKVLLLNGSPHRRGCTNRALEEVARQLQAEGIETEIFWVGAKPVAGCNACGGCRKTGKCVTEDGVNLFIEKAAGADGFVFGSPVHYAAASSSLTGFMNRVCYAAGRQIFRMKPGAAVVSARRAGTTAALDQINKIFTIMEMPIVSSRYWNMVHGQTPEDVEKDEEGLFIMRVLGKNMAYLLKCMEAGKQAGIRLPEVEAPCQTNFIR